MDASEATQAQGFNGTEGLCNDGDECGQGRGAQTRLTREEFNIYCASFPHAKHVVQWGRSDVWKIGGKVFAICGWAEGEDAFTFKVGDLAFEVLPEREGVRPAPYLASRGMKWLQQFAPNGLSDEELKDHIALSFELVIQGLTKKKRAELGF